MIHTPTKNRLQRLRSVGKKILVSDGFNNYPNTDGLGYPKHPYKGGRNKTWGLGYGTWVGGGTTHCTALVGGSGINACQGSSPNMKAAIKVTTYNAGWAGVAVRYINSYNFIAGYWDGTYVRLIKLVDSASTGLVADTAAFAAGSIISVECDLTTVRVKCDGVQIGTDQTVNDVQLIAGQMCGVITSDLGNYFDNFNAYPYGTTVVYNVLPFGDSKTTGSGDTTSLEGYVSRLSTTTHPICEYPLRIAAGGSTVASRAATIDADLAAAVGVPKFVLCNLGSNDVSALPAQATWEADYPTIITAIKNKWPGVKIYLMRVWRRTYLSQCNSIAAWIADLVTANSGLVYAGPDERVFLEGGDDGVTYTGDGIHPNTAGYALTATQWRTTLGL